MNKVFNISFGMSEIFLISSVWMYQQAFVFSMVLFNLALVGKFCSYAWELNEQKTKAESGEQMVKSVIESITNAIAISSLSGKTKNGKFH